MKLTRERAERPSPPPPLERVDEAGVVTGVDIGAREQVRALRAEIESQRQAHEKAIADARSAERESAGRMLAEGSELRASIERQREMASLMRALASTATASVTENSRNRRPMMPPISSMGMNTAINEMLMESTVKPISAAPFSAACIGVIPSSK